MLNESFELCNLVKNVKINMQDQNHIESEQGKEIIIGIILMTKEDCMLFGVELSERRLFEKILKSSKRICLNLMLNTIKKIDDTIHR
jgi:hypothetical protein